MLMNKSMKTKKLTFLLALTFLFLFSGSSVVFAVVSDEGLRDALNPNHNSNHKKLKYSTEDIDEDLKNFKKILFQSALYAVNKKDYKTALELLMPLAVEENAEAKKIIYDLAQKNIQQALDFLIKDAKQGDIKARKITYDLAKKMFQEHCSF